MNQYGITLLIILFHTLGIQAQENNDTIYLTVESTIGLAIANNPDLHRIRLNEDILLKQIQGAKGSALPQVRGTVGFTDNFAQASQLLPGEIFGQTGQIPVKFGTRFGLNAGVEVNQMLYNKEYLANTKKLDAAKATYSLQTLSTVEDLVFNVAQVYIQYQITQEQKDILIANYNRVDQLVNIAQAQFVNGIIKKLDVDQLKVNRTNLQSELSNLEIGAKQQLNVLRFYLALDNHQPIELIEALDNEKQYPLSDKLLLTENINYRILQQQIKLSELDNEVIRAGYYPTISAFAQYNYTGQADRFNLKKNNYTSFGAGLWGINLTVPIFDGLQKRNKQQENNLVLKQLQLNAQHLENASQMEFDNAKVKIQQNQKLINTQQQNMMLAQELYSVTKLSYQEGVAPLTELLTAETSLKEAQSQYLTALLNYRLAELEHIKVSGQMAQMIQNINNN